MRSFSFVWGVNSYAERGFQIAADGVGMATEFAGDFRLCPALFAQF
jgi:hypothetical protein